MESFSRIRPLWDNSQGTRTFKHETMWPCWGWSTCLVAIYELSVFQLLRSPPCSAGDNVQGVSEEIQDLHCCTLLYRIYQKKRRPGTCHVGPFSFLCRCIPYRLMTPLLAVIAFYTCIPLLFKVYFPFYWTLHVVDENCWLSLRSEQMSCLFDSFFFFSF